MFRHDELTSGAERLYMSRASRFTATRDTAAWYYSKRQCFNPQKLRNHEIKAGIGANGYPPWRDERQPGEAPRLHQEGQGDGLDHLPRAFSHWLHPARPSAH